MSTTNYAQAWLATLPELADLNEQLPYPNTIAEAYWLAEVACMCHRRLKASAEAPAEFWTLLNTHDANRIYGFLRDANDGVSNAANDLQVLAEPVPAPLCQYDDVCDVAADALCCIEGRLQHRGLQLESTAGEALRTALEGVLKLAGVEFLDDEGTPTDPNEQHREEVR
ncbi:hypothetical protein [Synechococcus sp. CCY9202]|uniref:hypothetical protein n=1 Tax=Synechococcus sp. CCY9202 TaxID=174698 RepID=UPI002B1FC7EE|nr:hypothetical protein [Synechococcus sp. CCY9202]MEA5422916.1 hypothetical protein [Synechococcus sp. CCY9202]